MKKSLKITPVKGRPMLHWVGKKPLDVVRHFPAQLCESVGVEKPPTELSYKEFAQVDYNLLFHGDNKEILSSLLVSGFRGKIDLIYIDPPFDSGADYVRKVKLRGMSNGNGDNGKLAGAGHTFIEQAQYEDIWANDNYLQFMYERLILLRELLSEKGSIYLHCDWHKSHHLRFLLDEVFGTENFRNEIIWNYGGRGAKTKSEQFPRNHDVIFWYAKRDSSVYNRIYRKKIIPIYKAKENGLQQDEKGRWFHHSPRGDYTDDSIQQLEKEGRIYRNENGTIRIKYLHDSDKKFVYLNKIVSDIWDDIPDAMHLPQSERLDYPTLKPEAILERIIKASSNEGSIVLDCFCGSGTTAAVAEKLNRRWVMADLNKGAIQTTIKRLQSIIKEKNGDLAEQNGGGLIHYRVNNYDYAKQTELKKIIISKYGIQTDRKDLFFDGTVSGQLAKITDLNKPLTRLDIQIIKDEIKNNRPDEERNIAVFCNGSELEIIKELAQEKNPINKIIVRDIQRDGIITNQPAQTEVGIIKKGKKSTVKISDYISPTILARMEIDRTIFDEQIDDFRAQIDCVLIDTDYNGKNFTIVESDLPEKRTDFVTGKYELILPRTNAKVAVKIVDMLGEETLVIK